MKNLYGVMDQLPKGKPFVESHDFYVASGSVLDQVLVLTLMN